MQLMAVVRTGLLGSLADVRHSLQGKGSDLVIRLSSLQEAFQEVAQQCSGGEIIAEEEVEHRSAGSPKHVSNQHILHPIVDNHPILRKWGS